MATNHYKNDLPDLSTPEDIPAILAKLAASIGQFVPVASRTEANQRLAQKGAGTGPLLVFRTDTRKFEVHPNTGASGETWLLVSPPDEITSRDVIIKRTAGDGSNDDYTIHELFQESFGKREVASSGTAEVNLISERPTTFDTTGTPVSFGRIFNKVPAVYVRPYIAPDGKVVHAMAVTVTTTGFHIRTARPSGYNPGAVTFTWIAVGEVGDTWNDGQ